MARRRRGLITPGGPEGRASADVDLAIVGGGPAGLATAIYGRLRGLSCVVFDRRNLPLEKACGEGVLPRGVDHLAAMGIPLDSLTSATLGGIRFINGGTSAEARFRGRAGRGIRRTELIRMLTDRARALGAVLHYGTAVENWAEGPDAVDLIAGNHRISARYLIGADGLHSIVRRRSGLERPATGRRRFGIRQHFRVAPWADVIEVHVGEYGEAYVTPVAENEVGVGMLGPGAGCGFDRLLEGFPEVRSRLRGAEALDPQRGAGPFRKRARRRCAGRIALVGDAAGYVDAITGEGLTLGFASADALVRTVSDARDLSDYERAYVELSRGYALLTRSMLAIARTPWLRHRVIRTLGENPDLLQGLVAVSDGGSWVSDVGARGVLRLARGVLR